MFPRNFTPWTVILNVHTLSTSLSLVFPFSVTCFAALTDSVRFFGCCPGCGVTHTYPTSPHGGGSASPIACHTLTSTRLLVGLYQVAATSMG